MWTRNAVHNSNNVTSRLVLLPNREAALTGTEYILERPAETGHRARMIYFEKNGFQYSTRVFVRKNAFRNKNNGTIGKSRKKSIDIGP